jgi:hypothetical protein
MKPSRLIATVLTGGAAAALTLVLLRRRPERLRYSLGRQPWLAAGRWRVDPAQSHASFTAPAGQGH